MNTEVAIKVENVSKTFRLPHEKQNSIKGSLISMVRGGKRSFEKQHVLKDVSFEIKKGEFFGIVGRNGSGKSTLLKMLAGIYTPSKGQIHVNGKLTPFIELGVGFNPELTGRENVFLNGALLGFNRSEMLAMYDDIVAFAEIEKFMDQKLKNYSSGMQVRLAFSIAIRAKSDILVLDEVLAVGDEAFQQKCVDIFENYKAEKQTIVLVTHDMESVRRFCTRAMLIENGEIIEYGEPNKVASKYSQLNSPKDSSGDIVEEDSSIKLTIKNDKQQATNTYKIGEQMNVEVKWPAKYNNVKNIGVAIIKNSGEFMYGTNTLKDPPKITGDSFNYKVNLDLGPGKYYLMAGIFGETKYEVIDFLNHGPVFRVETDPTDVEHGLVRLTHKWESNDEEAKR